MQDTFSGAALSLLHNRPIKSEVTGQGEDTRTFADQAKLFMNHGTNRKRKPFRPNTIRTFSSNLNVNLLPLIGSTRLQDVGNALVKSVVAELQEQGLSAATVRDNINLIKQIVKSAVDENGDQLFPRNWNSEHIDASPVENQKQPTVTAETIQEAISKAIPADKALYALLAGSGLRINEALGISLSDDGKSNFMAGGIVYVRSQRGGDVPKTKAGIRQVDLAPELETFIRANAKPEDNLMFPESQSLYRERMIKNGILGGFHTLRRFRISYLKSQSIPDMMIKFWSGHAASDMTERYTKVGSAIQERKEQASKAGLGFKLETA
jgi:integrase